MHMLSTHVSPVAHAGSQGGTSHAPSTQISPASQRIPQPPQFMASSPSRSTQLPPQHASGGMHDSPAPHRHSPEVQTFPASPQSIPQPPQSVRVLAVLTHAPSQQVRPPSQLSSGEQAATQTTPWHTVPAGQVIGQPSPPSVGGGTRASGTNASTPGPPGPPSGSAPPCAHPAMKPERREPMRRR